MPVPAGRSTAGPSATVARWPSGARRSSDRQRPSARSRRATDPRPSPWSPHASHGRSPSPCWSGLAPTTTSSATTGSAASASGRSGRQIASATASATTKAHEDRWRPRATSAAPPLEASGHRARSRAPSARTRRPRPRVDCRAGRPPRRRGPGRRRSSRRDRPPAPTCRVMKVAGASLRPIEAGQSTATHVRHPSRDATRRDRGGPDGQPSPPDRSCEYEARHCEREVPGGHLRFVRPARDHRPCLEDPGVRGTEEQPEPHQLAQAPPSPGIDRAGQHVDRVRPSDDQAGECDAGDEDAPEAGEREAATARCERGSKGRDEDGRGQRDRPRRVAEPRFRDAQRRDGEAADGGDVGAPRTRQRSRAASARTAPTERRGQHAERPQRPPVVDGREQDEGRRRDGDPGGRAPRRESQRGKSAATSAAGNDQIAAKTSESGRTAAAFAASASQWSSAVGTSRADGATSATSGNASGEAKPSSPRAMRPRSHGVPRFHSSMRIEPGRTDEHPGRVLSRRHAEELDAEATTSLPR